MIWWLIGLTLWALLMTLMLVSVLAAQGRMIMTANQDRMNTHRRINNIRRYLKLPEYPLDYYADNNRKEESTL